MAFDCDVVVQKMILDRFGRTDPATHEPYSEAQLVYEATAHGWLTQDGTKIDDMARLLESHGVPTHRGHGFDAMLQDLKAGHQVIAVVDADELWSDEWRDLDDADALGKDPNHAVLVRGLKVDDNGKILVVIHDPGREDGCSNEFSLEQFTAAFNDSDFTFAATDDAPLDWVDPLPPLVACDGLWKTVFDGPAYGATTLTNGRMPWSLPWAKWVDGGPDYSNSDLFAEAMEQMATAEKRALIQSL
jgi:hypothetical protein